jgi:hypothetical protein
VTGVVGQIVQFTFDVGVVESLLQVLGIVVGAVVVYQAVRGYRRNDSRAMLFLGLGLLALGPVHFALELVPGGLVLVALAIELLDILGLLLLLYSLTRA